MNINLEQDWLKLDSISSSTIYYGYNINPLNTDNSNTWAIRQVVGTNSLSTFWNNNTALTYECSWTNRAYYFATPSNITITATTSGVVTTTYNTPIAYTSSGVIGTQQVTNNIYSITFNWTSATGSSRYYVALYKNNGVIYNVSDVGGLQHNPYQNTYLKQIINGNSITLYNCPSGYTYSASVYASNGVGVSSTVTANISV